MKNSKRFSGEDWLQEPFLSPAQDNAFSSLFVGPGAHTALAVIDLDHLKKALEGTVLSLPATYLDPCEQERLNSFRFIKRRSEWFGGRIAAKKAALALLDYQPSPPQKKYLDLRVEASPSGRPLLRSLTDSQDVLPDISISHSGRYAGAVAVNGGLCGLDLQQITTQVIKVRERFASERELNLICPEMVAHGEAPVLSLLWSAKEALRKALACQPLAGFSELSLQRLAGNPQQGMCVHFSCPRLTTSLLPVFLALKDDFACAITILSIPSPSSGDL